MNSCAFSPPNSSRLSDTVIGVVMQRPTWKTRGKSSDCAPDNIMRVASSYQQQFQRHTYRHAPYQQPIQGYPLEGPTKIPSRTSKSTVLSPSVAELIGQTDLSSGRRRISCLSSDIKTVNSIIASIQGAEHHITAELQQAIVAEALKKKIRHRERCRINQARYRQRQMLVETEIEDAIAKLRTEIEDLQMKCKGSVRLQTTPTSWALASEYFRQFNYYLSSPGTLYKMASTFLHEIMAPDVTDGSLFGVDAQLENWRLLALYFGDVRVDLKGLRTPTTDTLIAGTVTRATITNNTLRRAFPQLNSDGVGGTKGGVWSPLAAKMMGNRLVIHGSVVFGWDCATDKVVSHYSQADILSPMLNLLGSLRDVSCAFFKARVLRFLQGQSHARL